MKDVSATGEEPPKVGCSEQGSVDVGGSITAPRHTFRLAEDPARFFECLQRSKLQAVRSRLFDVLAI